MGRTRRSWKSRVPQDGKRRHDAARRAAYGRPKDRFRFDPRKDYS